jgi:hypothetical protein
MVAHILIGVLAVLTVNAAVNAMSLEDRTFYGWLFRFGRLWTSSVIPFIETQFKLPVPTQQSAPSQTK